MKTTLAKLWQSIATEHGLTLPDYLTTVITLQTGQFDPFLN